LTAASSASPAARRALRDAPAVLLFSAESPHSAAPGSIVLQRLFADYPVSKLRVVTNHPPPPDAEKLSCRYETVTLAADRLNRTRFAHWRPILRSLGAGALVRPRGLDAALDGFAPDVVVTLMQDSWYYDLAAEFAFRRGLPLVLLVHDLAHGFEPVPTWVRQRQHERDRRVARQACVRLCISAPMAEYFAAEFGAPAEVLWPPRSPEPVARPPHLAADLRRPGRLTLGYAGGLHYGYGEQLLRMLPVLRASGAHVEVFGPRPAGRVAALAAATDVFTFNGLAPSPAAAWRALLERCDVLLQPYLDPPGTHAQQYRTHFPSKLGDALSLGLPLLITGPRDASGVAWCAAQGACAWHVDDPSPAALTSALERLRDDPALRVELATRAQAAATRLDAATLRDQFYAHLHRATLEQRA
jgi:glycosyltransferase involved in cell wall biosynthesis